MTEQTSDDNARHAERMARVQSARKKMMAKKTRTKGLIIVHTGNGKGKSSSGFGMILRCIGHGFPCAVVQFIKGSMHSADRELLKERFADICQVHVMGEGFTWDTQDRERDIAAARRAWEKAKELIRDPLNRMVLLDELNIALRYDYLDAAEIADFLLTEKPEMTHVVITGRNAPDRLIEIADLVTEMQEIKHPFRKQGIAAQPGVEF
ncbi:cob(I)yrinic acid a,c-diamide adenosyltransferase [Puniceibacterium confluentis]|uniref:cob(I)yrinic acid a,c-diamide adenosyltransferase n=1 Tax=Puniceibacterium confluentis TaxID=1958944 RepID=UPI0011B4350C|nr:cob(I)yrinic acid a,c-diamide adenosyltransferase [Puniceibacterium confluentis]